MSVKSSLSIPLPPTQKQAKFIHFSHRNWDIFSHTEIMMPSTEMELLTPKKDDPNSPFIIGVDSLPEALYGYNRMFIVNKEKNFCYEFSPVQMLNLCNYKEREKGINSNLIYYLPPETKVLYHNIWDNIKIEGRDDIKKYAPISDWTFASSYMGNITNLSKSEACNFYEGMKELKEKEFEVVKDDKMCIPLSNLGPENKILDYFQLDLFEDELSDNGISEGKFKFRVMDDCFYGLLRSYVRVDNVVIRNIDTRIYHEFGENCILRNFTVKEMSYDKLKNMGFNFSNEWNMSPNQSDIVGQYMGSPIFEINDRILL